MYNPKDTQFVGKHDYDKDEACKNALKFQGFSINIFKWVLKNNGKSMKRSNCIVRVKALSLYQYQAFELAESIVNELDKGTYSGPKNVEVKI